MQALRAFAQCCGRVPTHHLLAPPSILCMNTGLLLCAALFTTFAVLCRKTPCTGTSQARSTQGADAPMFLKRRCRVSKSLRLRALEYGARRETPCILQIHDNVKIHAPNQQPHANLLAPVRVYVAEPSTAVGTLFPLFRRACINQRWGAADSPCAADASACRLREPCSPSLVCGTGIAHLCQNELSKRRFLDNGATLSGHTIFVFQFSGEG